MNKAMHLIGIHATLLIFLNVFWRLTGLAQPDTLWNIMALVVSLVIGIPYQIHLQKKEKMKA